MARIDKGEEIVGSLKAFCAQSGVLSGYASGIGAMDGAEGPGFFIQRGLLERCACDNNSPRGTK